ncbi:MAG TPA: acyloxyacyl hydrolase [Bacteroidales bacterium]|mgnify:CR=1 FL=1|nr:acyloxyacyl hydrolase [Bacteroidales bacterium]HRR94229.1 acyloxyacyl hydrolase [Bacteroidales bacterium]HRT90051.1 acyloxyacyl hydrolase [Bacteroidales bacterium]
MKKASYTGVFILALCLLSDKSTGSCTQKPDSIYYLFGVYAHYGFIIPHSEAIRDVSGSNPYGIEFNLNILNTTQKSRSVFSGYWFSGLQAAWFSFNNPEILGGAFLLTGYAEPLIIRHEKFLFSVRGGGGISYHTKIYDETENPLNKFFCTGISFPIYVSSRLRFRLTPSLYVNITGTYNHISNGGIKQPNYGMNFPTISAGAEYMPVLLPSLAGKSEKDYGYRVKPWSVSLQGLISYKVVDKTETYPEKGTLATGIHFKLTRRTGYHYALSVGAEYINDRALEEIISRDGLNTDHKRVAFTAGQDLIFGKVSFSQHLGVYLYYPYRARDPVYQKYELSYKVSGGLSAGLFLKAHTYEAELLGATLSCRLAGW